jgi:protein-L-isoaspartate(D-aspartate) O-methyltransferase
MPTVVAIMLGQLGARPGDRVLEIGAGTGYNAALLAELVGETGAVTSVDIDPEVAEHARSALDRTGYDHVRVITADGALDYPERAPFDRIIVSVGPWDLAPAWRTQLAPRGRLVVPLRWRGQSRSIAFVGDKQRLRADSIELCGFIPMIGRDGERTLALDPDGLVSLCWDHDQPIGGAVLARVLDEPRTEAWSGVTVGAEEPLDGIWLRMTATDHATCRITARPAAIDAGLCTPAIPARSPALVHSGSLAYLTPRHTNTDPERPWELGAAGHGHTAQTLAVRLCNHIRAWGHARNARPDITAYPAELPRPESPAGLVIDKQHTPPGPCHLTLSRRGSPSSGGCVREIMCDREAAEARRPRLSRPARVPLGRAGDRRGRGRQGGGARDSGWRASARPPPRAPSDARRGPDDAARGLTVSPPRAAARAARTTRSRSPAARTPRRRRRPRRARSGAR